MKAFKTTFVIAICALAIGACAKKDGNFASKNAAGASPMRGQAVQDALNAGVKLDFFGINTVSGSLGTGAIQFSVMLMVNDLKTTVTTSQVGTNVASGQTNIGGYTVLVQSVCLDAQCSVLDIAATASSPNGQRYGQVAYKFFRMNPDASADLYMLFDANHILQFGDASMIGNVNTIVGFMNQVPDSNQ